MYSRILVPLDGSALAAQALPYAQVLGKALGTEIELFRVVPTLSDILRGISMNNYEDSWSSASYEQLEAWRQQIRHEAEENLTRTVASMRAAGSSVRSKIREGYPPEAIAQEAEQESNTLIVITTHGRTGLSRWWIGSVTDRVLHLTNAPIFVVRAQPEEEDPAPQPPQLHNVILPLDGSPLAEQAIPHAAIIATALNARVDLLHSVTDQRIVPPESPVPEAFQPKQHTQATEYLSMIRDRLLAQGVTNTEIIITEADAAEAIAETALGSDDSIIVMSTHGRSGIQRTVIGSVADKVARHSGCPVLLVRARKELPSTTTRANWPKRMADIVRNRAKSVSTTWRR